MIGLPCGEKNYNNMLSRFHLIPERHGRTDGRTDGQNYYINIARQSADAIKIEVINVSSGLGKKPMNA